MNYSKKHPNCRTARYTLFTLSTLFTLLTLTTLAQKPIFKAGTTIYLVRHTEKDTGNNPPLTQAGFERAGDLMRYLQNKNVSKIYSTKYKRTNQTADSLKLAQNLTTIIYEADTIGNDLVAKIKANGDEGKTILVVGHSNTVPKLIRRLGVTTFAMQNLPDTEFDNLFILRYKKRKVLFKGTKYGEHSGLIIR
ncbi:MAG: histidine phosphatase family protein [Ferruginibacter sp.]|nr:histidine phosphatase family protein [Ferruginibacter sp.]